MKGLLDSFGKRKNIIIGGIVSFLFSYSLFVGFICHTERYSFKAFYLPLFLLIWATCYFLALSGWYLVDFINSKTYSSKNKDKKVVQFSSLSAGKKTGLFFATFALIIISWIPCWLVSYPGFFSYDSGKEFVQIWYDEVQIWGRIPIIHSLLLWFVCKVSLKLFGEFNPGIAVFSWIHMLLGALAFSYEAIFLLKYTKRKWIYILSVLYFMFSPIIVLFSGCSNSTIFGSALAVIMTLNFYEIFADKEFEKSKNKLFRIVLFAVIAVFTCHARSSFTALFSILTVVLILSGLIKKEDKKKIAKQAGILLLILACSFLFNNLIVKAFKAVKPLTSEKLSMPLQQLANVYVKRGEDAFSADEKDILLTYYAEEHFQYYCPWCADPLKLGVNDEEFEQDTKPFYKLWLKKGIQYPQDYIEAWNYLTYEAWYPFCEPDGYTRRNYIESNYRSDLFKPNLEAPAEFVNLFPKAYEIIDWFSCQAYVHRIPVLGQICTIGYQYLILLFVLGYSIYKRKDGFRILLWADFIYFAVMLFAPIVLVRYYLLLFYLLPITLSELKDKDYE